MWVYEILKEFGFVYFFSIYLINYDFYGVLDWLCFKYKCENGLIEILILIVCKKGINIGIGGGGYFCFYFYWLFRCCIIEFM